MKILYLAIFILLILVFLYYFNSYPEKIDNKIGEQSDEIYTSGATMRVIGQTLTGANEDTSPRQYNILEPAYKRNVDIKELHKMQISQLDEHMVNEARGPEFWELNPILGQFKENIMQTA